MNKQWDILFVVVIVALCLVGHIESQPSTPSAFRLPRDASYFVVGPRRIRPAEVVQISVSILRMYHESLDVRAVIRGEDVEIAQASHVFRTAGTFMMQMLIPENTQDNYKNYTLKMVGSVNGGLGSYIFQNETELVFDPRQAAVFIQTNKPFYRQGQRVLFRVMPVEPNLMSKSGSLDVYIEDSTNTTVRRWLSMQTNAGGVLEMQFNLSTQPHYGEWKISVKAFGIWYHKTFEVHEYFIPAIDVNVSVPLYIMEDDFGLAGIVTGNLSLGQPVRGNCSIRLEIRPPLQERTPEDEPYPVITKPTRFFSGVTDFLFTMAEMRAVLPNDDNLVDKELYVQASVNDWFWNQNATGHSTSIIYSNDTEIVLLGDPIRTFKPNQTMYIYYAVVNKDGSPLRRQRRQITISGTEETTGITKQIDERILVRDDGFALFTYTPDPDGTFIKINAFYDNEMSRADVEIRATRHYSPTESFIYITTSTPRPEVDQYMVFTVTTNVFVERIFYIITAAGNIITGDTLEMRARQKTFSISVSRDMIPEAHIIVWQVYNDEVIADSLNFYVNGTRINKIELGFNRGKDFTGDFVEVNTYADPSSYVGFNGMDYQLWSYGWKHFITETDIIEELRSFEPHVNRSYSHKWYLPNEQDHLVHFAAPNYGVDANTTFVYAGLFVFTDMNMTRVEHNCNETIGDHPCMDGSCYHESQRCDGSLDCPDGQDEMGCTYEWQKSDKFTPAKHRLGLVRRHYLQDAEWLWGGHFVMPYGRLDLQSLVPDEPMTWVMAAFGISRTLGFGIVTDPVRHTGTRPFYLRLEAPSIVIKGEQVGIRIVLYNFWNQDLEVLLTLWGSPNYKSVVIEDYGIVSSYNPRLKSGDIQTMVYLAMGEVYELHFPVLMTVDGCVNVTISAEGIIYRDTEYVTLCNKYDGVTNYLNTPFFIDLISSGSMTLPDLEVPVPERFVKPEERQHLYVPGSPVCTVGVVGDVVGAGLFDARMNAEMLLNKPFGSAEQNMFNFAYKLYNLKYLKATNQLKRPVLEAGLELINIDLQRQLSYMNEDGSFSMFRDYQEYTPSTWVTAFVLRVLNDANDRDWESDMFIPTELLQKIAGWLCAQTAANGAFVENSPLYDRKMWPRNFTNINGELVPANYSLTAYVMISLQKAALATGNVPRCDDALKNARTYIENALPKITDVYSLTIITYALHLVGSSERYKAFEMMEEHRRENPYLYWADKEIPPNDIIVIDTIPYYQPRRWYDNEAYAVEATAYAMQTYLLQNRFTESTPIMKWLQTMRNTFAAQSSTQDSVTALQALYEYAKLDTNRALYNIRVELTSTSMGNSTFMVALDKTNWPDLQQIDVFPVWGSVRGTAQGTGLAIMQMYTRVNVEYPNLIMPKAEEHYFDVEIAEWNWTGRNFSIIEMRPCARWARPDISARSGLAVLEIHIPTGYVVTNDVLREYAQSGDVPTLRRAERYDRKVVYYFDYLEANQSTCVNMRIDRWYPVANMTIQHLLRVFDYYEPGMHNTSIYNTWALFNLHMCQVCGSYQCPYCPYYNSAPSMSTQYPVIALIIAVITIVTRHVIYQSH